MERNSPGEPGAKPNRTTGTAGRVSEVDLLRFLASLAVMLYHTVYMDSALRVAAQFGFMGVHLFFMISGFVILWTALKKDAYEFIASRLSRLYPSFWMCVLLTYVAVTHAGETVSAKQLWANMTMLPAALHEPMLDSVYWTLAIEIMFYVLVLALLLTRQMAHIEPWLYGWLVCSTAAQFVRIHVPGLYWLTLGSYAPLFIAGCFLYLVHRNGATAPRLVALAGCFLVGARATLASQAGFTRSTELYVRVVVVAVLLLAFVVFFLIASRRLKLPESPLWYWLGAMTYPLYLIHYRAVGNMLVAVPKTWWHAGLHIALALAIALVLAAISERRLCPMFNRLLLRARAAVMRLLFPAPASRAAAPLKTDG